jgi:hypothetical protein
MAEEYMEFLIDTDINGKKMIFVKVQNRVWDWQILRTVPEEIILLLEKEGSFFDN